MFTGSDLVLKYAVLAGATPLIPVPFLDDIVLARVERAMVSAIFGSHGHTLNDQELEVLVKEPPSGCLVLGCFTKAILWPIKKIVRKLLFVLEIKRATDIASFTLTRGFLLDAALRNNWWTPDGSAAKAEQLGQSVMEVARQAETSPMAGAVRATFQGMRKTLAEVGSLFGRLLGARKQPDEPAIAQALEEVQVEEEKEVQSLVSRLRASLEALPQGYFQELEKSLWNKLSA
ncbi:MAG: hypothetical protein AB7S38_15665 [Vulcanimicrobiota bacterium]